MKLEKKVCLVTGGAHRVGKAIALGLAAQGARLGLHYHRTKQHAKATLEEVRALGSEGVLLQGDFRRVADIKAVVDGCVAHFGRIDVLINNAAIYFRTPLGETTEQQWDDLLGINLKAPFFCSQFAAQVMKKQGSGKIVNIADVAGINPWPGFIPYSVSKAGLISLTRGLAKALAPDIQVNAIASGTVLMSEGASEEYTREIREKTLLKKIGSPEDVVNTVLFLLQGSDYITGAVIPVDGGRLLL